MFVMAPSSDIKYSELSQISVGMQKYCWGTDSVELDKQFTLRLRNNRVS